MSGTKKFWTGVLWGALAGGAISYLIEEQGRLSYKVIKKHQMSYPITSSIRPR